MSLGPDARALLDAAQGADEPTEQDRDRLRGAIVSTLAGSAAIASSAVAGSTAAAATGSVVGGGVIAGTGTTAVVGASTVALTAKIVAAVAVASVVGAVAFGPAHEAPSEAPAVVELAGATAMVSDPEPRSRRPRALEAGPLEAGPLEFADVPEEGAVVEPATPVEVVEAVVPATPRHRRDAVARGPARTPARAARQAAAEPLVEVEEAPEAPEAPATVDSLGAELRLLRAAQRARAAADPARAESLLRQHAQSFPNGALALERDATLALCACDRGAGAAAAASFLAAHPGSPLAARVRAACAD